MPLPVERLNKNSKPEEVHKAIDASFPICIDHEKAKGKSQEDAKSMCGGMIYDIAKDKTGRSWGRK